MGLLPENASLHEIFEAADEVVNELYEHPDTTDEDAAEAAIEVLTELLRWRMNQLWTT